IQTGGLSCQEEINLPTLTNRNARPSISKKDMKSAACLKTKPSAARGRRSTKSRAAARNPAAGEARKRATNQAARAAKRVAASNTEWQTKISLEAVSDRRFLSPSPTAVRDRL